MAGEARRHSQMAPLVQRGLFEEAELTSAEYSRVWGGDAPEPPVTGTEKTAPGPEKTAPEPEQKGPAGAADRSRKKRKRKLVVSGY